MIDTKSKLVLKILAKQSTGGSYKIFESADIISALPTKYRTDSDGIRHILTYLEHQDMISIKYDDDDVYCLSVMPYGFEILENDNPKLKKYEEKSKINKIQIFLSFTFALLGAVVGVVATYFLLKLF